MATKKRSSQKKTVEPAVQAEMQAWQYRLLENQFMQPFANKRANPRMYKCESLFQLARAATGPILEMGAFHGCGTVALAWGAEVGTKQPVMTCDPYTTSTGWIGEAYVPEDEEVFWANLELARITKVTLFKQDANALAEAWEKRDMPLGLLFWDIGGNRLFDDWVRWHSFIRPGGLFAVHDTGDMKFGFDRVSGLAQAQGEWEFVEQMPGYVYLLRRSL